MVGMLIGCAFFEYNFFLFIDSPNNVLVNSFLMALTGFFIGGPANLISSAVSADLGKFFFLSHGAYYCIQKMNFTSGNTEYVSGNAEQIRGSSGALSTVTGIIDGTGSVGAGIGQLLIPEIVAVFSWTAVFYGFIIMVCISLFFSFLEKW